MSSRVPKNFALRTSRQYNHTPPPNYEEEEWKVHRSFGESRHGHQYVISKMPSQVIRPSHFRRKKIWDPSIDPSLNFNVSSIFLISKYYNVIEIIQVTFYKAYLSGELDQAYIYGKRYATMAMCSIPKHEYYSSPAHLANKNKSLVSFSS